MCHPYRDLEFIPEEVFQTKEELTDTLVAIILGTSISQWEQRKCGPVIQIGKLYLYILDNTLYFKNNYVEVRLSHKLCLTLLQKYKLWKYTRKVVKHYKKQQSLETTQQLFDAVMDNK